ncbi:MAG: hypothetical protein ACTSRG_05780 [Candidatus Helarchaeota archaeon]
MNNNKIISRLVDLTKEIIAIKSDIEKMQCSVDNNYKDLFNYAIYLLKECINEVSKIGFELK